MNCWKGSISESVVLPYFSSSLNKLPGSAQGYAEARALLLRPGEWRTGALRSF